MSVFQPTTLVADDKSVVCLRYVESMNLTREDEDAVVETLKDDITIKIRTVSGMDHVISMQMQKTVYGSAFKIPSDLKDLREAIFERWVNVIS